MAPTIFAARDPRQNLPVRSPSDGPSYALVTREAIALVAESPESRRVRLSAMIPARPTLQPGEQLTVRLTVQLPDGEYEFIAGYGGGVHETRALVSNPVTFDVRLGKVLVH